MYAQDLPYSNWFRFRFILVIIIGLGSACEGSKALDRYQNIPVYVIPDSLIPRDSFDLPFLPTMPPMPIPLPPYYHTSPREEIGLLIQKS